MQSSLILPMAAHVALAAFLYALLTVARAPAIWGIGRRADGSNPFAAYEPRISANLSNQFEWPLLFYVACLLLMQSLVSPAAIALAWLFIAGRVLHSAVQILTRNVRLRGIVFMLNFLAVLGLWVLALSGTATPVSPQSPHQKQANERALIERMGDKINQCLSAMDETLSRDPRYSSDVAGMTSTSSLQTSREFEQLGGKRKQCAKIILSEHRRAVFEACQLHHCGDEVGGGCSHIAGQSVTDAAMQRALERCKDDR